MPRIPTRIQGQPFGTLNTVSPALNAPPPPVAILQAGPAQAREQFNRPGIPLDVARALNTLQDNIAQAVAQTKADPTADKVFFEGITPSIDGNIVITHGLGRAYRGYRIGTVRNGYILSHGTAAPNVEYPASTVLVLFTQVSPWATKTPVNIDIEIW